MHSLSFSKERNLDALPNLVERFCEQVHDAGHMVPMDQPKVALEMLMRWTSGNLSNASSSFQRLDFTM